MVEFKYQLKEARQEASWSLQTGTMGSKALGAGDKKGNHKLTLQHWSFTKGERKKKKRCPPVDELAQLTTM